MTEGVFVCGRGGHAKVIVDIINQSNEFVVDGFIEPQAKQTELDGVPIFEESDFFDKFDGKKVVIAIGENITRRHIYLKYKENGFVFPNVIHPSAVISDSVEFGEGNVVMPNVVVNPSTVIGHQCVLNTSSVLEHDCNMGDFASLAPKALVCGNCVLQEGVYVGANASVIHSKTIGEWSVIAAQAGVIDDVPAFTMVAGVPAMIKKSIDQGSSIL